MKHAKDFYRDIERIYKSNLSIELLNESGNLYRKIRETYDKNFMKTGKRSQSLIDYLMALTTLSLQLKVKVAKVAPYFTKEEVSDLITFLTTTPVEVKEIYNIEGTFFYEPKKDAKSFQIMNCENSTYYELTNLDNNEIPDDKLVYLNQTIIDIINTVLKTNDYPEMIFQSDSKKIDYSTNFIKVFLNTKIDSIYRLLNDGHEVNFTILITLGFDQILSVDVLGKLINGEPKWKYQNAQIKVWRMSKALEQAVPTMDEEGFEAIIRNKLF